MRSEAEIFADLESLCAEPGYIHAIAYLCFRDNMILYSEEMTADDMKHLFSSTHLIRTETTTLIGLLVKHEINKELPQPAVLDDQIKRTEKLLDELHRAMSEDAFQHVFDPGQQGKNPFTSGKALREPIFYGGESAYSFQFRDLARRKYAEDHAWIASNKGFSISTAQAVTRAIGELQSEKYLSTMEIMRGKTPDQWTYLPFFTFTRADVAARAGLAADEVEGVLNAFTLPKSERNASFRELHDFNVLHAYPLIALSPDEFALFHVYSLAEALYDAPFYWMSADKNYVDTAMKNRGVFTEQFSAECLERVFGPENVYRNVNLVASDGSKSGEIDVLVLFGDRAIILQAKSKRLTLEARRGHDGKLKDDFAKSIQTSYDQGFSCAELIVREAHRLVLNDGRELTKPGPLKSIYILCVVSDHYPALSFQARELLTFKKTEVVHPPFVLDVFTLDVMTEMLTSPLHLLSYVDRRVGYTEKVLASHELTILSYHLKQNLWVQGEHDLMMLHDDISADLDVAMIARREGIAGKRVPDGILTRLENKTLGKLLKKVEADRDPRTLDFGFMVLTLSEDTVNNISHGIDLIIDQARKDGKQHDFTVGIHAGHTGLTAHCTTEPSSIAGPRLEAHCTARKYTERAQTWYGVCLDPRDTSIRFGLNLDFPWVPDAELERHTRGMSRPRPLAGFPTPPTSKAPKRTKVGRNDPCPCGSGRKYKKCHLNK